MELGDAVVMANIVLGAEKEEQLNFVARVGDGALSEALVVLKGGCMKFLGDYLVRRNTPLEEPDEVLEEPLSDDEEEEKSKPRRFRKTRGSRSRAQLPVDTAEAEEFVQVASRKLASMPYGAPGQAFVAFQKPEGVLSVGTFSNVLRFRVKEVDPVTGECEDEGHEDDYQLEDLEVTAADYILKTVVANFRGAWEAIDSVNEKVDEYVLE